MKRIVSKFLLVVLLFSILFVPNTAPVYAASVTLRVAAGAYFSLALKSDGTVWSWGSNQTGQLGDGTTTNKSQPTLITGLTDIVAIFSGNNHSLALKDDGTVWAWGYNGQGQLGDDTTIQRNSPVQVLALSNIVSIAGGGDHNLALKSDGTVWAWGYNDNGQLGDGTTIQRTTPVQVSGLANITSIAARSHNLALRNDGSVWAWGPNTFGQLGDGTTTQRNTPIEVPGLSGIIDIAVGSGDISFALKDDGTVKSWGLNNWGSLGDGTTTKRYSPVQVTGLSSVVDIKGGYHGGTALKEDGSVWAWGLNDSGRLGDGTTTTSYIPVQVLNMSNVSEISSSYRHTLAIKDDGTIWSWGTNSDGELGDGTTTDRTLPVQVVNFNLNTVPAAPINLTATAGDSQVTIQWGNAFTASGYNVKRAETAGGPYTSIASNITEATFTNTGLTNGTTYYYVVSAVNVAGESANSNEASATPQVGIPNIPTNLTATAGDATIILNWNVVNGATGYNVKRALTTGGPYETIATNITELTYTNTGLINGTTYYYVVSALNPGGESASSNEASATPQKTVVTGNRAFLEVTMVNGTIKEYDISAAELASFLTWYEARSNGTDKSYFAISKSFLKGPFLTRTEYIQFDKISSFEVMEYTAE